jgi:hypothetical protein
MVRWLKTVWADARKSGEWMADALPSGRPQPRYARWTSRYARWAYRWQFPIDAMFWLAFSAFLVLLTVLALVAVLLSRFG